MNGMLEFQTPGFNGYAVKYSPFFDSRIAVAASANFGLVGNGRLYILGLTANGIQAEKWYVPSFSSGFFHCCCHLKNQQANKARRQVRHTRLSV
jgi:hypothetical protein